MTAARSAGDETKNRHNRPLAATCSPAALRQEFRGVKSGLYSGRSVFLRSGVPVTIFGRHPRKTLEVLRGEGSRRLRNRPSRLEKEFAERRGGDDQRDERFAGNIAPSMPYAAGNPDVISGLAHGRTRIHAPPVSEPELRPRRHKSPRCRRGCEAARTRPAGSRPSARRSLPALHWTTSGIPRTARIDRRAVQQWRLFQHPSLSLHLPRSARVALMPGQVGIEPMIPRFAAAERRPGA